LSAQLKPGSIALIPAAKEVTRNHDCHYRFRQQSDFQYLTAFPEPDALAVIVVGEASHDYILFTRPRDATQERWQGTRQGPEGACQHYGADQAYPLTELAQRLPALLQSSDTVYYSFQQTLSWLNRWLTDLQSNIRQGVNPPWRIHDLDQPLQALRVIKSSAEIAQLKQATAISSAAHTAVMQACRPGMHEYELLAEFNYVALKHGCLNNAYEAIVASGANACVLHYVENTAPCQSGDLVLIDAGAEYQCYAADITRTFPVNGRYSAEQAAVYEVVLNAQLEAIASIKPGVTWDTIASQVITCLSQGLIDLGLINTSLDVCLAEKKYQQFYMHNFGHWLGLDVHDAGAYKQQGQWRQLQAGMVLTVEPGIYISPADNVDPRWWNIGIRVEDDVHVIPGGVEVLSTAPKTIAEIESIMHG
jgi:Xaa-Pro aminopeptidase